MIVLATLSRRETPRQATTHPAPIVARRPSDIALPGTGWRESAAPCGQCLRSAGWRMAPPALAKTSREIAATTETAVEHRCGFLGLSGDDSWIAPKQSWLGLRWRSFAQVDAGSAHHSYDGDGRSRWRPRVMIAARRSWSGTSALLLGDISVSNSAFFAWRFIPVPRLVGSSRSPSSFRQAT